MQAVDSPQWLALCTGSSAHGHEMIAWDVKRLCDRVHLALRHVDASRPTIRVLSTKAAILAAKTIGRSVAAVVARAGRPQDRWTARIGPSLSGGSWPGHF